MDQLLRNVKLLPDAINKTIDESLERCFSACHSEEHLDPCPPSCLSICPDRCYYSPEDSDAHSTKPSRLSSLLIVMVVLLAATFFVICLYVAYVKFQASRSRRRMTHHQGLNQRRDDVHADEDQQPVLDHPIWYIRTVGLQSSIINSIAMFRYKRGDGLVEGTECSVCLNEFQEDETLRILPKCSHAFHTPCIDTWLRSHTNCPMCRAPIVANAARARTVQQEIENGRGSRSGRGNGNSREEQIQEGTSGQRDEPGRAMEDGMGELRIPVGEDEESEVEAERARDEAGENEIQPMRRSASLDSLSASKVRLELANVLPADPGKLSNTQLIKVNGSEVAKRISGNKSYSSRFRSSSSVGISLQNGSSFMRRSLSYSGQILLSMYSRSQNSSLPL